MRATVYTPSHFSEVDGERIARLIDQYGFATLISSCADGLQITDAPLLLDRTRGAHGTLMGHVARANPHAGLLVDGADIFAIFHGPHSYISPAWYVDENSRDLNAPGWNYVTVHVRGHVRRIDDDTQKWEIVRNLVARHEQNATRPWVTGDVAGYACKLSAIVGFEVEINTIEAKSKLSQNRSVADQEKVIEKLEAGTHPDGHTMARLMRENIARRSQGV